MNIPGKLREDLKRIYGAIDPLNCIEDIRVEESSLGTEVKLTLRVPMSCERYAQYHSLRGAPYSLEQAMMCGLVSSKSSEKEIADIRKIMEGPCHPHTFAGGGKKAEATNKKDTLDFVKPERILFSGPYTHVFWPDGSKTSVKLGEGEKHDEYTAFCAAVVKKMFGATHKAKKFLEKVKVIQKKKKKEKKNADDSI